MDISGCNFDINTLAEQDYEMEKEGESQPILREFALLCAKIRDEYGDKLAEDFGDTPPGHISSEALFLLRPKAPVFYSYSSSITGISTALN